MELIALSAKLSYYGVSLRDGSCTLDAVWFPFIPTFLLTVTFRFMDVTGCMWSLHHCGRTYFLYVIVDALIFLSTPDFFGSRGDMAMVGPPRCVLLFNLHRDLNEDVCAFCVQFPTVQREVFHF